MLKNTNFVQKIWIIVTILLSLFVLIWSLKWVDLYEGFESNTDVFSASIPQISGGGANPTLYNF
jgi:hypothetical protein